MQIGLASNEDEALKVYATSPVSVHNERKLVHDNQIISFSFGEYYKDSTRIIRPNDPYLAAWPSGSKTIVITGVNFNEDAKKLVSAYLKKYPSSLH